MNDTTPHSDAMLERLYAMPNACKSIDDYHRARHEDLAGMTVDELWTERRCVQRRLDYERDAYKAAKLTTRLTMVVAELARRCRSGPERSRSFPSSRPLTPDVNGTNVEDDVMPSGARFMGGARRVG